MRPRPPHPGASLVHEGATFDLYQTDVPKRGGGAVRRELIWHGGAVVILPITDDGRVVLIKNKRYAVDQELIELAAGTIEASETPETTARRELQEETGYTASTFQELCHFYTSPGCSNHHLTAFVATGLTRGEQSLDATEKITVITAAFDEVLALITRGEILDAKTIATVLAYDLARRRQGTA